MDLRVLYDRIIKLEEQISQSEGLVRKIQNKKNVILPCVFVLVFVLALLFEVMKQLVFSKISLWSSHWLTIFISSGVSVIGVGFIMRYLERAHGITQIIINTLTEIKMLTSKYIEEVHEENQNLINVVDFLPDPTFVVNREKEVIYWNKSIELLTGLVKFEVIGQKAETIARLIYGCDTTLLFEHYEESEVNTLNCEGKNNRYNNFEVYLPNTYNGRGSYCWISASPLYDKEGNKIGYIESIKDITARKQMENLLKRYQLLSEYTNDIILFIQNDGSIIEANKTAILAYGYSKEELLTMKIYDLCKSQPKESFAEHVNTTTQKGRTFESIHHRKDGTTFPVEVSSVSVLIDQVAMNLNIVRDISERVKQRQMLEEANQAKSNFLALVSHEIRTPMNSIIGMTELALAKGLSDEQRYYLDLVKDSADSLLILVNHLLDLSKIEAGKMELVEERINLKEIIINVISTLRVSAEKKSLELRYCFAEEFPENLIGDSVRIKQILYNLIGNAIKFTDKGHVTIDLKQESADNLAGTISVSISITDTGIGIPESKLGHLFQSFSQISGSDKQQGTGLGLVISKYLVEMMGGMIQVKSKPKVGTTFNCLLVFKQAGVKTGNIEHHDDNHHQLEELEIHSSNMAKPLRYNKTDVKIMLVEDNLINQKLVQAILSLEGYNITVAGNGDQCLTLYNNQYWDLILMDVMLPDLDGITLTEMIRQREQGTNKHTPIIALTASAMKKDKQKCLAVGMDDFVSKPINRAEFLAKVDYYINQVLVNDLPHINVNQISKVMLEDRNLFAELVEYLIADYPRVQKNLFVALESNDVDQLKRLAHYLKGQIINFGAECAYEIIVQLEKTLDKDYQLKNISNLLQQLDREMLDVQLRLRRMKEEKS